MSDELASTKASKAAFLKAYEINMGIVTHACDEVGISRTIFYKWIKTDQEFKKAIDECKIVAKDFGYSKLVELMSGAKHTVAFKVKNGGTESVEVVEIQDAPNPASVIFFNKTINKDRGFIESTEILINELSGKSEDELRAILLEHRMEQEHELEESGSDEPGGDNPGDTNPDSSEVE